MANANGLTNLGEQIALSAILAEITKIALSKAAVNEDGTGIVRPAAAEYADQAVTLGNLDTVADPATIENTGAVSFGDLEADETVTHWAGLDASDQVVAKGALAAPVSYQAGVNDPLSFPAGALVLTMD